MSSPSPETQVDVRKEAEIRKRLDETQMPVDMDLTDFEIKDLPSPPSLFVKKILPEIFSHKREFNAIPPKQDKESFKRKPGVTYLYDLCAQHRLAKSGNRPDLEKRLLVFFFKKPDAFATEAAFQSKYDADLWKKFNDIDETEKQAAEAIRNQGPMPQSTVFKSDFRPSLLNVFYLMLQAGDVEQDLNIDSDGAFSYNGLRYEFDAVRRELAGVNKMDFIGFDTVGSVNPEQPLRRRTQECLLRLLTIIFMDDEVFKRFLLEVKENPKRADMDSGETRGNANIWQTIHKNFIDDAFPIADFFVDDEIYYDANGNLPDIKTCRSKWASPTDLYKWYKQVHADMVKIKANCDRSGKHGFSLKGVFNVNDEQYQDFVQNFARGQKAICYLGALAMYRGTESFDWFTNTMPDNVAIVDGMEADGNDEEQKEAAACAPFVKKSRVGSTRGQSRSIASHDNDEDFGETAIDRLAAALNSTGESHDRNQYYKARARQIHIQNEEIEETREYRMVGSAMGGLVSALKDVSAARELSNLALGVQEQLNSVESNVENLLASLNNRLSRSRKRSWDSSNLDEDEET
jgi:hypothetical protein